FFFQAEDGIRDGHVTGVQTCALPISTAPTRARRDACEEISPSRRASDPRRKELRFRADHAYPFVRKMRMFGSMSSHGGSDPMDRSEERRVGKECSCRRGANY